MSTSGIYVYPAKEMLAAFAAHAANPSLPLPFIIEPPKPNQKEFGGTLFLRTRVNTPAHSGGFSFFCGNDVVIRIGVANPSDANDTRNEYAGMQTKFTCSTNDGSDFGRMIDLIDREFIRQIDAMRDNNIVPALKRRLNHEVVARAYRDDHKVQELRGKVRDHPLYAIKASFGTFPDNYPVRWLAGKPRTTLYDWRTRNIDPITGVETFQLCTVDGQTANLGNLYKILQAGAIIRRIRVSIDSAPIAKAQVSLPIALNAAWIEPAPPSAFSDDLMIGVSLPPPPPAPSAASTSTAAPAAPAAPTSTAAKVAARSGRQQAQKQAPSVADDDDGSYLDDAQ